MNIIPTALYVSVLTGTLPSSSQNILDCPSAATRQECLALEYVNQINGNGWLSMVIYPTGNGFKVKLKER